MPKAKRRAPTKRSKSARSEPLISKARPAKQALPVKAQTRRAMPKKRTRVDKSKRPTSVPTVASDGWPFPLAEEQF